MPGSAVVVYVGPMFRRGLGPWIGLGLLATVTVACSTSVGTSPEDAGADGGCPKHRLGSSWPAPGTLHVANNHVLLIEIGDIPLEEVRAVGPRHEVDGGVPFETKVLAPGLLQIETCGDNACGTHVQTESGETKILDVSASPVPYFDHTPPQLESHLRFRAATSTQATCGAQSTFVASFRSAVDPREAEHACSTDAGGAELPCNLFFGAWFSVPVHLLYEHPRGPGAAAVGYAMTGKTGPQGGWIHLDDLSPGRHCYVLGAMDNSGNLTVDGTPACIDVP